MTTQQETEFKYNCYDCVYHTNDKTRYNNHLISRKHKIQTNNSFLGDDVIIHNCKECNKKFLTKIGLNKHLNDIHNIVVFCKKRKNNLKSNDEVPVYNEPIEPEENLIYKIQMEEMKEKYNEIINCKDYIIETLKKQVETQNKQIEFFEVFVKSQQIQQQQLIDLSGRQLLDISGNIANSLSVRNSPKIKNKKETIVENITADINTDNNINIEIIESITTEPKEKGKEIQGFKLIPLKSFLNIKCKEAETIDEYFKKLEDIDVGTCEDVLRKNTSGEFTIVEMMAHKRDFRTAYMKVFKDFLEDEKLRPFHCTDVKRKYMRVKEKEGWKKYKDDEFLTILINNIGRILLKKTAEVSNNLYKTFEELTNEKKIEIENNPNNEDNIDRQYDGKIKYYDDKTMNMMKINLYNAKDTFNDILNLIHLKDFRDISDEII